MGRFSRQFGEFYERIASDIFLFARALGLEPTWQQAQLLGAVQRGDRAIAVRSGQGVGKTSASGIVALWRAIRAVNSLVVVTAPTMRQCNEVWLAEIRRLLAVADPWIRSFIKPSRTKVSIAGQTDWGIKTMTATTSEAAQGFHEKNLTIIFEEASGVPRAIHEQFEGTLSNPNSLFLQIGNPNLRDCAFFDCFTKDKARWTCLHWDAERIPRSEWFDPGRNDRIALKYGKESDVYKIRVKGEFPSQDPNCVLSSEDLGKVTDRTKMLEMASITLKERKIKQFGLDFARYGGDENTCFRRSGNAIVEWKFAANVDPSTIIDTAFGWQRAAGWSDGETYYVADAGGMGQGLMHKFYNAKKNILEFHNNGVAVNSTEYDNKITEAWFGLAQKVKAGQCYLPDDPIMHQQLVNRQYFTTKKGKLILESKDDYMRRGNDSPDRADGLVEAMYDHAMAVSQSASREGRK